MELTDAEAREVEEVLNTMDATTVNLLALDKKYDKEWYEQQLDTLQEMDDYFADVERVMEMADRDRVKRSASEQRDNLSKLIIICEDAIEDLESDEDITRRM